MTGSFKVVGVCTVLLIAASCSQPSSPESGKSSATTESSVKLTGSGASFPFPLYDRWFKEYSAEHDAVRIDYQAKGSGAGIKDLISGTVDFGASDAAMTDEEIAQVDRGVVLLPMTAGEVVLAFNLDGVTSLNLTREAYVGILLGKVTQWSDLLIQEANPEAKLPDLAITVVRRADSSGTTFVLTNHLAAISNDWSDGPGIGKTVVWPDRPNFVAAPKNDGVTATIMQTPGAIGYVEYGFAKLSGLNMAALENHAGQFVTPSLESGQAALETAEMPDDLRVWLPDPEGEQAYPIVSYTWLLCYGTYDDPQQVKVLKELVNYCLTTGQEISDEMGYVPLPAPVVERVTMSMEKIR